MDYYFIMPNFEAHKSIIIWDFLPIELVKSFPKFKELVESKNFFSPFEILRNQFELTLRAFERLEFLFHLF
jgi:hypothetical protein